VFVQLDVGAQMHVGEFQHLILPSEYRFRGAFNEVQISAEILLA
jgi:hypothetical protein